jgi:hypothetical protein
MTRVVATLLFAFVARTAVFAQTLTSDAPFTAAAPRLEHPVALRDAVYVATEAHRLDFDRRHQADASLQTSTPHRVRHPVLLGAVIGGATGFVLNASACRTGESVCTSAGNLMMAGIGAGVGAFVGWLVAGR